MMLCIEFILKNIKIGVIFLPLVLICVFSMANTSARTFKDSNAFSVQAQTAVAIQNDVCQQIIDACEAGQDEVTLHMIKCADEWSNWPHTYYSADILQDILYKFGLIDRKMAINPVASLEYNAKFGMDIVK